MRYMYKIFFFNFKGKIYTFFLLDKSLKLTNVFLKKIKVDLMVNFLTTDPP